MKKTFKMIDLECANCAAKMEAAIKKLPGVNDASVSFLSQKLMLDAEDACFDTALQGLNCAPARVGRREVETCYLPVFEAGITRGGAYNVMSCYNSIDGEVVGESPYYLKEVLKDRFGLKGISRADWGGVHRLMSYHRVTTSEKECVRRCLAGGLHHRRRQRTWREG